MAKKKNKQPNKIDVSAPADTGAPFNNAFAKLASLRADMPDTPAAAPPPPAAAARPAATDTSGSGKKIVLSREKKGRGGKTVTRVAQLDMKREALDQLAERLKRALGCGGTVEGQDIVLAGDQTDRAATFLSEHTKRRIVVGN